MKLHKLPSAMRATRKTTIRPARRPGVSIDRANSHSDAASASVRHARPNSNRCLKPMLFHAPVKRAAAQPELARGERNVEMVHSQSALDHLLFELVEIEAWRDRRDGCRVRTPRQRKILDPEMITVGH